MKITNLITFNKKSFVINIVLFVCLVLIAMYLHDSFIRPFFGDVLVGIPLKMNLCGFQHNTFSIGFSIFIDIHFDL